MGPFLELRVPDGPASAGRLLGSGTRGHHRRSPYLPAACCLPARPADPSLQWRVSLADFPHPSLETGSTVGRVAPTFLLAAIMVGFVVLLTDMVRAGGVGVRAGIEDRERGCSEGWWCAWVVDERSPT